MEGKSPRQAFLRNTLIGIGLLALIFAPRPLAGLRERARADRALQAGHYAEAASAYQASAERLPWQPSLWEQAGLAAYQAGASPEALDLLGIARRRDALSGRGWLALGDIERQNGRLDEARSAYQQAQERGAASAEVQERLVPLYRARSDIEAALEAARLWVRAAPDDPRAHFQAGLLLAATQPEDAIPELHRAAQLDPALDVRTRDLLAGLSTALLVDDRAYRLVVSGRSLASLDEWDLAGEAFSRAAALRPDYADAWAWLGEARQHLGLDGLEALRKAVSLEPDSAMIQSLFGIYWQRQDQPEQAVAAYRKAADLEPQIAGWQVALGSAYEQAGDLASAYEQYSRAVALAPQDASTWRALAAFSVDNNSDVAGVGFPAAQRLLALAPEDWQARDIAGQATLILGNWMDAEHQFLKAIQLAPEQAVPHLHLGLAYLQAGDRLSAYHELVQASLLDPDGAVGWQAERYLDQYFPGWR